MFTPWELFGDNKTKSDGAQGKGFTYIRMLYIKHFYHCSRQKKRLEMQARERMTSHRQGPNRRTAENGGSILVSFKNGGVKEEVVERKKSLYTS
jgi:hypothetical protein